MAKISRTTQTIFASSASNIGQFGSAEAGTFDLSSSVATLQALSAYVNGWSSAVISGQRLPCLEELNALHYIETSQICYLFQEGIPEYDAGTNYFQHSIVKKAGTYQLYGSLIDNNLGNALTVGADWKYLGDLSAPQTFLPVVSKAFSTGSYTVVSGDAGNLNYFSTSGTVNISGATIGAGNIIGIALLGSGGGLSLTINATAGGLFTGSNGSVTELYINNAIDNAFKSVLLTSDGTNLFVYSANNVEDMGASQSVRASHKNLAAAWASTTTATLSADELMLEATTGETYKAVGQTITFTSTTSGAGGLDTGSIAANTWYYGYMIYNPSTNAIASLFSLNASNPTLPSGYTHHSGAITALRTDGSSHFIGFKQYGNDWQWVVGSNLSTGQRMANGAAGSTSTPTWVAVSVSNFVPTAIAHVIKGYTVQGTNNVMVAPNNSYGAFASLTNGPPVTFGADNGSVMFEFVLESTNIYWASDTTNSLFCLGFRLNI